MKSILSLTAIILGMLLMLVSATWVLMFPPTRSWTQDKSEQLSELGSETNRLKFAIVEAKNNPSMHSGQNPAELQQQYDEVREEYDVLHQEFLNASQRPQNMSTVLRWSGIALIIVGAVMTFIGRSSG
jgi:hypothetical protein